MAITRRELNALTATLAALPAKRISAVIASPMRISELILTVGALALGLYICASTILMVFHYYTIIPYWDQWDNLILSENKVYSGIVQLPAVKWFFSQHNEHRIAVPRAIFWIDRFLFSATNEFNFSINVVLSLGSACLMYLLTATFFEKKRLHGLILEHFWIAGVTLALMFSAMQWENFLWGFQVQFFGVVFGAIATFITLAAGRPSYLRLVVVILLETVSVYTLASGILVPLLVVGLAVWIRQPPRHVGILAVAGLSLAGSYFYGYQTPVHNTDPLRAIWHLGSVLSYLVNEIGNPFGLTFSEAHIGHVGLWNRVCGVIGLACLIAAAVDMVRRSERGGPVPVLIAVAFFVLGMELLTALGRLGLGEAFSSRYSTPVLVFWLALVLFAAFRLVRGDPRFRIAAKIATFPVLLGLAYYQPCFIAIGRAWALPRLEATTALLASVNDPSALIHAYPQPSIPKDRAPWLRERHLSIFSEEWSNWLGTPLADHTQPADKSRCRGKIGTVEPVGKEDATGWRASGWAWDVARGTAPSRVVITDAEGRVLGYGLSGFPAADVPDGAAWHGYFASAQSSPIAAFALLENGRVSCRLAPGPS